MKILTFNTHSLVEKDYETKLLQFAEMAAVEQPEIMGLQEVNQRRDASALPEERLKGYVRCEDCEGVVREGNHAARLAGLPEKRGICYFWTWIPIKVGYDIYEEGLALFSRRPILETDQFTVSRTDDFHNWRRRKILGIRTDESWFYTVHMGWWKKDGEAFADQWDQVLTGMQGKIGNVRNLWVMGDFNSPAQVRGEGYDYVKKTGWKDAYLLAEETHGENTVEEAIDGWRDEKTDSGMRIDYIWSLQSVRVKSCRVICDGKEYPQVSDHFGVMIETEEEKKVDQSSRDFAIHNEPAV
ncbi:MAG: endonuclease/exonuclease/phosphatase family protein [Hominisplanchenecus sp.]